MDRYVLRSATTEDIPEIFTLIQVVGKNDDRVLFSYSKEYSHYEKLISNNPTVVATINGKIVGAFLSFIQDEDPLGVYKEMGFNEFKGVALLEECVVDDKHRGHNLEQRMGSRLIDYIKAMSKYYYYDIHRVYVTVHPQNTASLRSLDKIGFKPAKKTKLYGGMTRYILVMNV